MTYATTFSGIGGWEIGLNVCGWDLRWQCESDPWCQRLLKERFGVPVYDDIRTIIDRNPPPVDALIGSPPCQPFSVAGAQRGAADERHLFPAFIDLVHRIRPRWVLMEQVPAILSNDEGRAFGGYVSGLVALGYDLLWHSIPACAVGANHQRDRLWIVGHAKTRRIRRGSAQRQTRQPAQPGQDVADASSPRLQNSEFETLHRAGRGEERGATTQRRKVLANTNGDERDGGAGDVQMGRGWRTEETENDDFQIRTQWSVEPNVGRVADGVPLRAHRLKGLGNAVIPQIPYIIGQAINQIEATTAAT